jgi:hypothetical protein
MTQQHPIIPPPELVQQWLGNHFGTTVSGEVSDVELAIATQAARWGADQELEACCEWFVRDWTDIETADTLRAARRPKPPSLKKQAKFAAAVLRSPDETCSIAELQQHWHTICNALESLPD